MQYGNLFLIFSLAFYSYYNNTFLNVCFGWILDLFLWIGRFFRPTPVRISNQAWSFQQASFLIQDLCLLSQSKGISTLIMEGFSHKEVRELCGIPKRYESILCVKDRYQIASIVAFGYEPKGAAFIDTPRFPFGIVFELSLV